MNYAIREYFPSLCLVRRKKTTGNADLRCWRPCRAPCRVKTFVGREIETDFLVNDPKPTARPIVP